MEYQAAADFASSNRGAFFAAAATPMGVAGDIPAAAVRSYFRDLIARGADGLAVNAHTGRGPFLTTADKLGLINYARETGAVTVSGVSEPTIDSAAAFAAAAAAGGADALLVFPCDQAREQPTEFLNALWAASKLPLILFDLYTQPYSDASFEAGVRHPAVAGAKLARLFDGVASADRIGLVRRLGKLAITGEDRMFGASLMWGAQSALVGLGAAALEMTLEVFRSYCAGQFEVFVVSSQRLDAFASGIFAAPFDGYVQRMLWVAADEGIIAEEHATDHFAPFLDSGERRRVLQLLQKCTPTVGLRRSGMRTHTAAGLVSIADRA